MGTLGKVAQRDPSNHARTGKFDSYHAAPVSVSTCEEHLHNGESYIAQALGLGLPINGLISLCFKTPTEGPLMHFRSAFASSAGGRIALFEGAQWDAETGIQVTIVPRNRAKVITSQMLTDILVGGFSAQNVIAQDPTGLAVGGNVVTVDHAFGQNKVPAGEEALEVILKPDTQYCAQVLLTTAGDGQIVLQWSEHVSE